MPKDAQYLISSKLPGGKIHKDHLTDELAALLIGDGVSHYVELIRETKKAAKKS